MITLTGIAGLGMPELVVIVGILVLLFGATRIPALARSVGKSINEFKRGMSEGGKEGEPGGSKPEEKSSSEKKD